MNIFLYFLLYFSIKEKEVKNSNDLTNIVFYYLKIRQIVLKLDNFFNKFTIVQISDNFYRFKTQRQIQI